MRINESTIRRIIREEARSSFREGIDDDFDDEPLHPSSWRDGEGDDEEENDENADKNSKKFSLLKSKKNSLKKIRQ